MSDDNERYKAEDGDRIPSKKTGLGCGGIIFVIVVILNLVGILIGFLFF